MKPARPPAAAAPAAAGAACRATMDAPEHKKTDATLADVQTELLQALPRREARILHINNGDSRLPEELYELGFHDQHANDISPSAIARMRSRTAHLDVLRCEVEDALQMPQHASASFDVVLDEGTFDKVDASGKAGRLIEEAWRVLRPGGVYVMIASSERAVSAFGSAFGPPAWARGQWAACRSTHVAGARECWVHCATKAPELPEAFARIGKGMGPVEYALMVDNLPVRPEDEMRLATDLLAELDDRGRNEYNGVGRLIREHPAVLSAAECAALRRMLVEARLTPQSQYVDQHAWFDMTCAPARALEQA